MENWALDKSNIETAIASVKIRSTGGLSVWYCVEFSTKNEGDLINNAQTTWHAIQDCCNHDKTVVKSSEIEIM